MPVLRSRSWVAAPPDRVFAFFDDPENLARLMPPPVRIRVVRVEPAPPRPGSVVEFRYGLGPVQLRWVIRLVDRVPGQLIRDDTLAGPVARFLHAHTFMPARGGGTWIEDRVEFHVGPDGPVGTVVDAMAGLAMRATFIWRHVRQRQLLR